MGRGNYNQRLNGLNPLAYIGDNSYQPPEFVTDTRAPTSNDSKNFELGTIWLNTTNNPPTSNDIWMLVSLYAGVATWVNFASGTLMTLTSNSGGPVSPTAGNINVVGDGTTIVGVGNPGTSTITFSVSGTGVVSSLTGNSGGAVFPTAGNINVLGTGVITVVGNPGTSTLTITPSGDIASSFPTDSGTATPSAGVLNIKAGVSTLNSGSSVEFTGSGNTVLLNVTDAIGNTIIGKNAGKTGITGIDNTAIGFDVLTGITTGSHNITIGNNAGINVTTESDCILIGDYAQGIVGLSGTLQIGSNNSMLITNNQGFMAGNSVGNLTGTGVANYGIGNSIFNALTTGRDNVAVGGNALIADTTGSQNTVVGVFAGSLISTGGQNTLIGSEAGWTNTPSGLATGNANTAVGFQAGNKWTSSESNNTIIGTYGGIAGQSGMCILYANNETILHNYPGSAAINGRNIFVGGASGNFTNTGISNCALGGGTLGSLTTGPHNIAIGNAALAVVTSGNANIGIGNTAGYNAAGGTGLTTGAFNTLIGYTCGTAYIGAESNNILIGNLNGVPGENQVFRVGGDITPITKTFIQGIRGITTVNADAVAVLIDSAGQLGTVSSSIRYKENVHDMACYSEDIYKLRPVTFNYKEHGPQSKTVGLIAEEVDKFMPSLVVYKDGQPETVKYHELVPMLLNEIQKLHKRIEILENQ